MIARELINQIIPPLKPNDSVEKAVNWMEELRVNQLPVVDNGTYLGLVREEELINSGFDNTQTVSGYPLVDKECFVYEGQHFLDILKTAGAFNVQTIAVLDEHNNYIGAITLEDTIVAFAQTAAVQSPGAIIVLSINQIDYSMAEISRLIESENGKILSSSVSNDLHDTSKIKLTVKINKKDLTRIIATLERFGYKIIASFHETEVITNEKERLDILLKYLDI